MFMSNDDYNSTLSIIYHAHTIIHMCFLLFRMISFNDTLAFKEHHLNYWSDIQLVCPNNYFFLKHICCYNATLSTKLCIKFIKIYYFCFFIATNPHMPKGFVQLPLTFYTLQITFNRHMDIFNHTNIFSTFSIATYTGYALMCVGWRVRPLRYT